MATVASQLDELETKLKAAEDDRKAAAAAIEANRATLQLSELKLQKASVHTTTLQDKVDATRRVASAAESAGGALASARDSGVSDATAAKEDTKAWDKLIADALPAATLKKLPKVIKKVDDAIASKQKDAAEADKELSAAEVKLTTAQDDAAAAAAAHDQWQAELLARQQRIDQSRALISATKNEAKAALDAGKFETAFVKLREVDNAVKALESATDATEHATFLDQLPNLWAAVVKSGQAVTEATDELTDKRAAASAAHIAHEDAVMKRADAIDAEIGEPADATPTPPPDGDEEPDQ